MSSIERNKHMFVRRSHSQPRKNIKNVSPTSSKSKNLFSIIRSKFTKKGDATGAISTIVDNESPKHKFNTLTTLTSKKFHTESRLIFSLSDESLNTSHSLLRCTNSHTLCRHATSIPRRKQFTNICPNQNFKSQLPGGLSFADKEYCQATERILKLNKNDGFISHEDKDIEIDNEVKEENDMDQMMPDNAKNRSTGIEVRPTSSELISVAISSQPYYDQLRDASRCSYSWNLTHELFKLSSFGWYWGPLSRTEAEEKLAGQPDGSFLVRDSSNDRYLLSLSFRSHGCTLHTRIEHCNGSFSFYTYPSVECHSSIGGLIESSMCDSQVGPICYSRTRQPGSHAYEVRLSRPVSRFAQIRTLKYWCRFVIRQSTRLDHIRSLPLPGSLKNWLEEGQF